MENKIKNENDTIEYLDIIKYGIDNIGKETSINNIKKLFGNTTKIIEDIADNTELWAIHHTYLGQEHLCLSFEQDNFSGAIDFDLMPKNQDTSPGKNVKKLANFKAQIVSNSKKRYSKTLSGLSHRYGIWLIVFIVIATIAVKTTHIYPILSYCLWVIGCILVLGAPILTERREYVTSGCITPNTHRWKYQEVYLYLKDNYGVPNNFESFDKEKRKEFEKLRKAILGSYTSPNINPKKVCIWFVEEEGSYYNMAFYSFDGNENVSPYLSFAITEMMQ